MPQTSSAAQENKSPDGPPVPVGQRAVHAVAALRYRAGALASAKLSEAAEDLVAGALGRLEARLRRSAGPMRSLERVREILERDRALTFAGPPAAARAQPAHAEPVDAAPVTTARAGGDDAPAPVLCEEPIRTRTMARLLAAQGHVERALSIYAHLLRQSPGDSALLEEAAAARAIQASL